MGFGVLMIIDIPVIRDLAMNASVGIAALIFTNLVLLPVLLSYVGVSKRAAERSVRGDAKTAAVGSLGLLERFTTRSWAVPTLALALGLMVAGYWISLRIQVGDVDPGAPELRAQSRYNRDVAFIAGHYGLSSDLFAVIVKAPAGGLMSFEPLIEMDRLEQVLQAVPGVQVTTSFANVIRVGTAGNFEGTPKWSTIDRDASILNPVANSVASNYPELVNQDRSTGPVIAYLSDHKAATLDAVVAAVKEFATNHDGEGRQFLLAAGSAGIEAATNIAVREANKTMPLLVYAAVIALCFVTFRSWRAVVVAVVPLVLTSLLCEALMVMLGIGIKVATLPVIALGVGIGVDYALYLLSVQLSYQRQGMPLRQAYAQALQVTGKVVLLVGVTLALGVISWAWSQIKFQADMGILLAFMFLWNMVGALVLIPALSHFLLQTESIRPVRKSMASDPAAPSSHLTQARQAAG
jgi:predicted RND superfamily exporter protein